MNQKDILQELKVISEMVTYRGDTEIRVKIGHLDLNLLV